MSAMSNVKKLIAAGTVALVGCSGAATAFAATATGMNNPDLTVSVTVTPDLLHVGNTATATGSVTNNTTTPQTVTVSNSLVTPQGQTYAQPSSTIQVAAMHTAELAPEQYVIKRTDPKGTYTLTVSATDSNGTSSATTQYTITK